MIITTQSQNYPKQPLLPHMSSPVKTMTKTTVIADKQRDARVQYVANLLRSITASRRAVDHILDNVLSSEGESHRRDWYECACTELDMLMRELALIVEQDSEVLKDAYMLVRLSKAV